MLCLSRRPFLISLALLASLSCAAFASAQSVYVSGANNEFGTVDVTTGVFTPIGAGTTTSLLTGLAFAPDGTLYGINDTATTLYTINTTTGALTTVGGTGLIGSAAFGLASAPDGTLFLVSQDASFNDSLYTVDPTTGAVTLKGPVGDQSQGSIAVVSSSLYQTNDDPSANVNGTDVLTLLNPATGAGTPIGAGTGAQFIFGLANVNGTLYGFDDNKFITTIDTTTGLATFQGTYTLPGGDSIFASTFPIAAVPEPSALALLVGMGITSAGFLVRRQRTRKTV